MTSYCTKCGTRLSATDRFCSECGAPLEVSPAKSDTTPELSRQAEGVQTEALASLPETSPVQLSGSASAQFASPQAEKTQTCTQSVVVVANTEEPSEEIGSGAYQTGEQPMLSPNTSTPARKENYLGRLIKRLLLLLLTLALLVFGLVYVASLVNGISDPASAPKQELSNQPMEVKSSDIIDSNSEQFKANLSEFISRTRKIKYFEVISSTKDKLDDYTITYKAKDQLGIMCNNPTVWRESHAEFYRCSLLENAAKHEAENVFERSVALVKPLLPTSWEISMQGENKYGTYELWARAMTAAGREQERTFSITIHYGRGATLDGYYSVSFEFEVTKY